MCYENFKISENYVVGKNGYKVNLKHGTSLIMAILHRYTEEGTGITREELKNEAFNCSIGQELHGKKCNLDPKDYSNRVNHVLSTFASDRYSPDGPGVELRDDRYFLTRVQNR
jgi:hypothetical protein